MTPITTIQYEKDGSKPISPTSLVSLDVPATTSPAGAQTVPISGITFDVLASTQYGSSFGTTDLSQDGYTAGTLQNFSIDRYGLITGFFTNGTTSPGNT